MEKLLQRVLKHLRDEGACDEELAIAEKAMRELASCVNEEFVLITKHGD